MRIKKVSQTSGYIGTVSNSYSGSTTDTYSCDYINKIGTIKQGFGDIFTSDGTYTANIYSHLVATYIGNNIWKIDYISRFENNSAPSDYYGWGLSISNIGNLLNLNLQTITTGNIDNYSNWYLYNTNGNLILDKIDYGTVFEYYSNLNRLLPARIYNTSGSTGGWGLDLFSNNYLLKGTIYLKEV